MCLTYHKFKVDCSTKINLKIKVVIIKVNKYKKVRGNNRTKESMLSFEKREELSIKLEALNIILTLSLSLIAVLLQAPMGICPENRLLALSACLIN